MFVQLQFQFMWNGHLGRINVSKHCVKLLQQDAEPVYTAPYRASPKLEKLIKLRLIQCSRETSSSPLKPNGKTQS